MKSPTRFVLAMVLGVVAAGGVFAAPSDAGSRHSLSGRIYFYSDLSDFVGSQTPLVRPRILYLTHDGSIVLKRLRWSGWGSSVAHTRAVVSSSSCNPSCATGKRTNTPARLSVSHRKSFMGHRVYGCYRLTVRSHPRSNQHECIGRIGNEYGYVAVSARSARTSANFFSPGRKIDCLMGDDPASANAPGIWCNSITGAHAAGVNPSGKVDICTGNCLGSAPPNSPTLAYGRRITVGRFRCSSSRAGITCVVVKTGRGFRINSSGVARVRL